MSHCLSILAVFLCFLAAALSHPLPNRIPAVERWSVPGHEDATDRAYATLKSRFSNVDMDYTHLRKGAVFNDIPKANNDEEPGSKLAFAADYNRKGTFIYESMHGCLMHWHCVSPIPWGFPNIAFNNSQVRQLIIDTTLYWWDIAAKNRNHTGDGFIGHISHMLEDCHPPGHTVRGDEIPYNSKDKYGTEDAQEKRIKKEWVERSKCGFMYYFEGDPIQDTDMVTQIQGVVDPQPATHNWYDQPPSFDGFNSTEHLRQTELFNCSVFVVYRLLRDWHLCRTNQTLCKSSRADLKKLVENYVVKLAPGTAGYKTGGSLTSIAVQSPEGYEEKYLKFNSTGRIVSVYMPTTNRSWNGVNKGYKTIKVPLCRKQFTDKIYSNFFNPVGTVPLSKLNEECVEGEDIRCESNFCLNELCMCNKDSDCGNAAIGWHCNKPALKKAHTCVKLPLTPGACTKNSDCSSKKCSSNVCTCSTKFKCPSGSSCKSGKCVPNKAPLEASCKKDSDCSSNNCDDGCCTCTNDAQCGAGNYCWKPLLRTNMCQPKNLPVGAICNDDAACKTGLCSNGQCRCKSNGDCNEKAGEICNKFPSKRNKCGPREVVGGRCDDDDSCLSGKCTRGFCVCDEDSDCKKNFYCEKFLVKANKCTMGGKKLGDKCSKDGECLSGQCDHSLCSCDEDKHCAKDEVCVKHLLSRNECLPGGRPYGDSCEEDEQCKSGKCEDEHCTCSSDGDCKDAGKSTCEKHLFSPNECV